MDKEIAKLISVLFIAVIVLFVGFGIHGSSIGVYNQGLFKYGQKDSNLLLFHPRAIRSDEWLVSSPYILSQYKNDFKVVNRFIGIHGQNMAVLYDAPTKHWSTFFKPHNYGFFVLPIEQAFALRWWFRDLVLFIGAALLLTKILKNRLYAVLSSLALVFTAFNQWWSIQSLYYFGFGSLALYAFLEVLERRKTQQKLLFSLPFIYFTLAFIFSIYPPFQISILLLLCFIVLGYFMNNKRLILINKTSLLITLCSTLFVGLIILLFYIDLRIPINLIANTVYPGSRTEFGGNFNPLHLLNGFYNMQLIDETKGVALFENQSEASSFFMLSLFCFPIYLLDLFKEIRKRKVDFLFLFIGIYLIISLWWIFFPLPKIFAKLLLLNFVPPKRMIIGIGIANYLLVFISLLKSRNKSLQFQCLAIFLTLLTFIFHIFLGFYLKLNYPEFIQSNLKIFLVSTIAGVMVYSLLRKWKCSFIFLLLGYSIITVIRINPVYRNLDIFKSSKLSLKLREIEQANYKKHRWIVYDELILGNYLLANGIHTLNGVYLYPQLKLWKKFDKNEKYSDIYNRYAHIVFTVSNTSNATFSLVTPDYFQVSIDPCSKLLRELNVKYYIFPNPINRKCMKQVAIVKYPTKASYIYKNKNIK